MVPLLFNKYQTQMTKLQSNGEKLTICIWIKLILSYDFMVLMMARCKVDMTLTLNFNKTLNKLFVSRELTSGWWILLLFTSVFLHRWPRPSPHNKKPLSTPTHISEVLPRIVTVMSRIRLALRPRANLKRREEKRYHLTLTAFSKYLTDILHLHQEINWHFWNCQSGENSLYCEYLC